MLDNILNLVVSKLSVEESMAWRERLALYNSKYNNLVSNGAGKGELRSADIGYEYESSSHVDVSVCEKEEVLCEKCDEYGHDTSMCPLD